MNLSLPNRNNFYSERLSGDYRRLYFACVDNLARGSFTTTMEFSSSVGEDAQLRLNQVLEAVFCGNPELFFVDQQVQMNFQGNTVTLSFPRKHEGKNLTEAFSELNAEIDRIAQKVLEIEGDYDRVMRVNKYLCARVRPSSSLKPERGDAYGALIQKEARCEGFAKAAKLIFDRVGINCIVACGEAADGSEKVVHAWNILELGGKYYHFDFTWNAGSAVHKIPGQEYAFLDDETIKVDHFPKYTYPECTDNSLMFWVKHNGLVKYHSDLSRAEVVPFGNNFLAMAKFLTPVSQKEIDESAFEWMRDELSAYSYGVMLNYAYNPRLKVISFYMANY